MSSNDPRIFFAAERTLLAWNRTGLALMAFGFVIERIGLFVQFMARQEGVQASGRLSFWLGITFIMLGSLTAIYSGLQFHRLLGTFRGTEIPPGYAVKAAPRLNLAVAALGFLLVLYLLVGLQ